MQNTLEQNTTKQSEQSLKAESQRQTLSVAWVESEFFQVWLKLARSARGETQENLCEARR